MAHHIMVRRTGWSAACLAAVWLSAAAAHAQTPKVVNLDDVVRATIEKAPDIAIAREEIAARTGQVRKAKGTFDLKLHFGSTLTHTDAYISSANWGQEYKRRTTNQQAHDALVQIARQLDAAINQLHQQTSNPNSSVADYPLLVGCPAGATYVNIVLPGQLPRPICQPITSDPLAGQFGNIDQTRVELSNFFMPAQPWGRDPMAALDFISRFDKINGLSIPDFVENYRQQYTDALFYSDEIVHEFIDRTQLNLDRLKSIPSFDVSNKLQFTADVSKPLRGGGILMASGFMDGTEYAFRGRPMDPDFGGSLAPNTFHGGFEGAYFQPLMRGRGKVTVTAGERSAATDLEAGRFSYLHTLSKNILDSTLAYIDLIAAQQSLALLEDSRVTQRSLLDLNMRLSAGGDIARADVTRMQARVADVETSVAQARQQLIASQASLAQAAGLKVDDIRDTVRPGDKFPEMPPTVDLDSFVKAAVTNRNDIKSAVASRESARILMEAARADTKWRLDLEAHAGYSNTYTGSFFRLFPEEYSRCTSNWQNGNAECFEPSDTPINWYNLFAGTSRAFGRHWGPQASIKFTLELPFGNNKALGRLEKARAAVRTSDIQVVDLERVANTNVAQQAATLQKAKDEWLQRQDAVLQYLQTWADTEKRRQARDISLIDTLQTEQSRTSARLSLVQAQHDYAAALAKLRYESGMLVVMRGDRPEPDLSGLVVR